MSYEEYQASKALEASIPTEIRTETSLLSEPKTDPSHSEQDTEALLKSTQDDSVTMKQINELEAKIDSLNR